MPTPVHAPTVVEFGTNLLDYEFTGASWIQLRATAPGLTFGGIGNAAGLAPPGLQVCVQNAGTYAITITHSSPGSPIGSRFAMHDAMDVVLQPAADPTANPLGGCLAARYAEGYDAPWSVEP